jgi:hypothetical protein
MFTKTLALKGKQIYTLNTDDTKTVAVEVAIKSNHEIEQWKADQLVQYFTSYQTPQGYTKKDK